jgi:RarD protein
MSAWLSIASSRRRARPVTTARADHRFPEASDPAAYASVAGSAVIWGSIGLVVRLVHMSAIAITFYRVLIGAVSILLVVLLRGQLRQLRPQRRRSLGQLVLMAGLYTVNWLLYFYALQLTTVGNAALAYYTAPAFMALFGALFLEETLDRRTLLYVAVAFAGLYVLLDPSRLGGARLAGILAGVGAGVAYAAAVVTAKPLRKAFTPWSVAAYQTTGAALMLAPCLLLVGGSW